MHTELHVVLIFSFIDFVFVLCKLELSEVNLNGKLPDAYSLEVLNYVIFSQIIHQCLYIYIYISGFYIFLNSKIHMY